MSLLRLTNSQQTAQLGYCLGQSLPAGSTILLYGDLGSGKTTLVKGLGQSLGISDSIVSPTFTIINEYPEGRTPLYHFDLYRLQPAEVVSIHPELYWEGNEYPPGITAIEWAEHLPYKPQNYLEVRLESTDSGSRQALIVPVGKMQINLHLISERLL